MGYKILLVDDVSVVRMGVKAYLSKSPLWETFIEAVNGKDALEKVQKHNPDAILTDIEMPIMDGLTFLGELQKLKKAGKVRNIPAIVLSGAAYQNEKNVLKAISLGASDVFPKPDGKSISLSFDVKAIEKRLLALIQKSRRK